MIVSLDGKRMELDEVLAGKPGQVQFAFERNRLTLKRSTALTEQGEKQASQGRFEAALKLFQQAGQADPFAPHCRYQAGLTLLYLGRYADAIDAYSHAVKLNPSDKNALFRLGVADRIRHESARRRPGDFQAAIDAWGRALWLDPNQYIWRRRIEQYGIACDATDAGVILATYEPAGELVTGTMGA